MKITKKIDNHYRIIIPKEIRDELGLCKQHDIDIYVEDGKIIIDPHKIHLGEVLSDPITEEKEEIIEPTSKTVELPSIDSLSDTPKKECNKVIKANKDNMKDYVWENGTLKLNTTAYYENIQPDLDKEEEIKIPNTEERISSKIINKEVPKYKRCPQCGGDIEPESKLRLNGKIICKSCVGNLKRDLLYDIFKSKQLSKFDD